MRQLKTLLLAVALLSGCSGGSSSPPPSTPPVVVTRTWRMGFSPNPPRPTVAAILQGIDLWSQRAELAAIHEELPWTELLNGVSPDTILERDKVALVNTLRGHGLKLYFMADLTDGLSRGQEAPQLRALGRSITEPAVRQVYRAYVLAVVRKLNPDYIGLAAETNLIRAAAPAPVYAAVVTAANEAAADLRAAGDTATVLTSVQVETAWGLLGNGGAYIGVTQDFADFAFVQMIGLSSYPYFAFKQPEDLPGDYYSRLLGGRSLPVMVVEGGWASAGAGTVVSSPALQARYFPRQAQLLDSVAARGVIQLLFADLDLSTLPAALQASLAPFATLGLTDSNFTPKPALPAWDALYGRPLKPPM
jgi:hypothetical protein